MTAPTPVTPIDAGPGGVTDHLEAPVVLVPDVVIARLRSVCAEVDTSDEARQDAGRDWWPIAVRWAMAGETAARPVVVVRPADAEQVAAVLRVCHEARVPVTPMAGRSGVCGASVPVFGGVSLDTCALRGVTDIDDTSLVATVGAGTFGPDLEATLATQQLTVGHWPQSMALSTVGGWVACRGAGQYSTRYGKIEDMVAGLQVVTAEGRQITTGGAGPRAAMGPDLTQLILGSEGTLGVVTAVELRLHPAAPASERRSFGFTDFTSGLEACRLALRRGATPAVLRLYDEVESARNFDVGGQCVLVVLDEADEALLDATMGIVAGAAEAAGGEPADPALVDRWLEHRNDVSALAPLYRAGIVVDTVEVAGRWATLPRLYDRCRRVLAEVPGTMVASAHQSHAYSDGACLYFTFAGRPDPETKPDEQWAERYYVAAWDAVMGEVAAAGGALSHHHGIGLNRARFMDSAPGTDLGLLQAVKDALDPRGILNPGKLGLRSPFGAVRWPPSDAAPGHDSRPPEDGLR